MKTIEEIIKIRDEKKTELQLRVDSVQTKEKHILVCRGTGCTSAKSPEIMETFRTIIKEKGLENVRVVQTGCFGLCAKGPIVIIRPDNTFYSHVTPKDCEEIILSDIIDGKGVERLLVKDIDEKIIQYLDELPFYQKQRRVALKNCGVIDPEEIEEYIAFDGYQALIQVLTKMNSDEVIRCITDSGLRGRGGAGFSTGKKWEFTKNVNSKEKYIICNADEGDPGAFMDRSILEGDPHTILEAMLIAGYTVGAGKGYVYVRAEYPIAVQRLKKAIQQAKEYGILGEHIFGTAFSFEIEIRLGAGAFVCGEETALLESIEGRRGEPRLKPPFPAVSGLFGKPTLINNVETLANITQIILHGAKWYESIGTKTSKGTKVFALGGNVVNVGLVEVPMGTTLREIIYDIGGGIPNGKTFKAVQTGGPSGGCIPEQYLDTPIDYESLGEIGSMMGSGGMIVLDEDTCMVDIAKFYLEFTVEESCGKCTPCRIGNLRLYELLNKITLGDGTLEDIEKLKQLSINIKETSLCGLGQTSPNPVLSAIKYFEDEFIEHVTKKECRAKRCKSMVRYEIDKEKCIGCTICAKNCPVDCIIGELKVPHEIIQKDCIKCGTCFEKCPVNAINKI